MSLVDIRIEEWKRKIVDLSRRNRLLFFSRTRGSTLQILQPSLKEVFERLVDSEKSWEFYMPPDAPEEKGGEESESAKDTSLSNPGLLDGAGNALEESAADLADRDSDELLTDIKEGKKLRNILRNLYRRSRTDFEERGVRILFLTFGMLEWKEVEQSEVIKSPILLVPVELKRDSVNDPFELHPVDEEIIPNPALAVKLGDDFKLELPPIPEDWDEISIEDFLGTIRGQVAKYDWKITETSWIGLFSFHKLVIYHDLRTHAGLLGTHSVVRRLCEEEKSPISADLPEPKELDTRTTPTTSFLVADADSSQLVCIEAVKSGSDLVIQGPPGTGKSQTITNLISEFIARGKSVLFVSEKMAALEVVFQRIQNASLGHFCLQLHSHRTNKREVIQELYKTYNEQLQPKKGLTEFEAKQLMERRRRLNDYVHSLHVVRQPLGCSAFEVFGRVAELEEVLYVPAGVFDAARMTPELLDNYEQLANRLKPMWALAVAGRDHPWFGCIVPSFSLTNKVELQETLRECADALTTLLAITTQISDRLGFLSPSNLSDTDWLLKMTQLLTRCPGIERNWILNGSSLNELEVNTKRCRALSQKHAENRQILESLYTSEFFALPNDLKSDLRTSLDALSSRARRSLVDDTGFVASRNLFVDTVRDFSNRIGNWTKDGASILQLLGLQDGLTIKRIRQMARIAQICESSDRPDESWLEITKLRNVSLVLPGTREKFERRNRDRRTLLAEYDAGILELDARDLAEKWSGPYASLFRIFRPGYYRTKRQIKRLRKSGQLPHDVLADLRRVQNLKELEAQLSGDFARLRELFGVCFRGFDTDFGRVSVALAHAQELLELANVQPVPPQLIRQASAQGLATLDLRSVGSRLRQSIEEWEKKLEPIGQFLPADLWRGSVTPLDEEPLDKVGMWVSELRDAASPVRNLLDRILPSVKSSDGLSCQRILSDLDRLAENNKIEAEISVESANLKDIFGKRFAGVQTSWDRILEAVQWTLDFKDHLGDRRTSETLLNLITTPNEKTISSQEIDSALKRLREAFRRLSAFFSEGLPAIKGVPAAQADFVTALMKVQELESQTETLRDWIDYKVLSEEFREQGLADLVANLISRASSVSDQEVPGVVRRALLQAWLNWVFGDDSCLGAFRGENHERLISEFRELDKKHWEQGAHNIVREVNRQKPVASVVIPGGEVQVLFKEANKQRRHLPLRKLFGVIPNLLTQLKPCLLMSPLSVSQFLDPERTKFDLVIFDEASQLRAEDAICSVYRGKQLVVCGDNKQLPPTAFFEQGMSDDLIGEAEDSSEVEAFDVYGSVLDACAAVMPQRQLKWHYRSEHESLIAFSNCTFYDYTLVTFPSWLKEDDGLGVKFEYVEDGVYDRGGKRDNVREAERIVELVEQHLRRSPEQSVGVVTFNISQSETVENYLEQFRRERPELERYFAADRREKFFVKNLESVQGDERDVLIFSVGYGKDKFGRLTMNFGPLNSAGGERRLNVAVTRARKKVIVVSSIRASDFDLNGINREGVRVLHRYLDFAERGEAALDLQIGTGEFESPFEQAVAAAIRRLGYNVIPQVGCSSFRVDLGVADPAHAGRFILGVECDGASYHSSATARDRDRIRQQILERMGWKIHRIWSPDWVTRRDTELSRLKAAIETAVTTQREYPPQASVRTSNGPIPKEAPLVLEKEIPELDERFVIPAWVVTYEVCRPLAPPTYGMQFHDSGAQPILKRMLFQIVEAEGPVHKDVVASRLAQAWGLERVGERMFHAVTAAWRSLSRENQVRIQGTFLWPCREAFHITVRQPTQGDDQSRRSIHEIPPEEIILAMKNLVRDSLSIEPDKLFVYVARIFGFERAGNHIHKALENALKELVEARQLAVLEDRVFLGESGR